MNKDNIMKNTAMLTAKAVAHYMGDASRAAAETGRK